MMKVTGPENGLKSFINETDWDNFRTNFLFFFKKKDSKFIISRNFEKAQTNWFVREYFAEYKKILTKALAKVDFNNALF